MPIALKLSKTFYDRFGDDVVGELVGMLNQVDAASQDNLREINGRNGVRFDAIDQRFDAVDQRFDAVDQRFDAVDQRFDAVDQRFDAVDQRFAEVDRRFERVEARLERVEAQLGEIRVEVANQLLVHTRWMIGMWVTVLIAVVGLWFRR